MATITPSPVTAEPAEGRAPLLQNGDQLTWPEFERRYRGMPHIKKAELVEGVVYMPSPISIAHATAQFRLINWLGHYAATTPGVLGAGNATLRLDLDNAPEPDAFLSIEASRGGQSQVDEHGYVVGAPELVAEVAVSSVSLDLHAKLHVYRRHGVREYVVWRVEDAAIDWFILRDGRYEPSSLSASGLFQSEIFPGLWLDPAALMRGDQARVFEVVQAGLSSPEHATFVARLQTAPTGSSAGPSP
jgi:Uma2 family endonuclease